MEPKNRIAQSYGYAVCLVCVIAFLISAGTLIGALFELTDPLHVHTFGSDRQPSLASFENYKMDVLRSPQDGRSPTNQAFSLDDTTLQAMYEAAKADKIQTVRLQAFRTITADSLLILVCMILFATHWIWSRRLDKKSATGGK
jgi:hypothetical protein